LVTEGKGSAFGVERQDLYDAAIALYQQSYASRTLLDGRLAKLEQGLKALVLDPVLSMKANSLLLKTSRLRSLLQGRVAPENLQKELLEIPAALADLRNLVPGDLDFDPAEPASAMADFYALARLRDEAIFEGLCTLHETQKQPTTIMVVGGFHTVGITTKLKEAGHSYVVITPHVKEHTDVDQYLYTERMLGHHLTEAQIGEGRDWARQMSSAQPPFDAAFITRGFTRWISNSRISIRATGLLALVFGAHSKTLHELPALLLDSHEGFKPSGVIGACVLLTLVVVGLIMNSIFAAKDEAKSNAETKKWLEDVSSKEQAEAILRDFKIGEIRSIQNSQRIALLVQHVGIMPVLTLYRALKSSSSQESELNFYADKVFPLLRTKFYDLGNPRVLLNRNLLWEGAQMALVKINKPDLFELSSDPQSYLTKDDQEKMRKVQELIRKSADFSDDALPAPSVALQIQTLYLEISKLERLLLNRLRKRMGRQVIEETRGELREASTKLSNLVDQLPPGRRRIGQKSFSEETNPFPLVGSIPEDKFNYSYYNPVLEYIQNLMVLLSPADPLHDSHYDAIVVFTSDNDAVAWSAWMRALTLGAGRQGIVGIKNVIISGGPGRYKPSGVATEADYYDDLMNTLGYDWAGERPNRVLEKESISIMTHAEAAAKMIKKMMPPGAKEFRVLFQMAPVMQFRGLEELRFQLERLGLAGQVEVVSDPSAFRDPYMAPLGWGIGMHHMRSAWEVVRELAKVIGERDLDKKIRPDLTFSPEQLREGLAVSKFLVSDPVLNEPDLAEYLARAKLYQQTIQDEVRRINSYASGASSAPWLLTWWWPLRMLASGVMYPVRLLHEGAHFIGLWASGIPFNRIVVDWRSLARPRVWVRDESGEGEVDMTELPGGVFSGIVGSWALVGATLFLLALMPQVAFVGALIVKSLVIGEALMNSIYYSVRYRGREIPSDMKLFVDGLREKLQNPDLFKTPSNINYDLYNVWDNWLQPSVRAQVIAMREQLLGSVQTVSESFIKASASESSPQTPTDVPFKQPLLPPLFRRANRFLGAQA